MSKHNVRKTREERLQEIRNAAKKVFLAKGYRDTTMEDIIAETDLSKGGFYHYYNDKKDIMADIMRSSNVLYMTYNDYMVQLSDPLNHVKKKELLLNAILDKFLPITPDKRLYTIFACEMLLEKDFWAIFLELESGFFAWLGKMLHIDVKAHLNEFKLISRVMNGLLLTQNIFDEPSVFEDNRAYFEKFFEPIVDRILSEG